MPFFSGDITDKAKDGKLVFFLIFRNMKFFFQRSCIEYALLRFPFRKADFYEHEVCVLTGFCFQGRRSITDQGIGRNAFRRIIKDDVIQPVTSRDNVEQNSKDQDHL